MPVEATVTRLRERVADVRAARARGDDEVERARWMALAQAAQELTYTGERDMAARALSRIAQDR